MLTIKIIAIGDLKEKYLRDACDEYKKRLGAWAKVEEIVLKEEKLPDNPTEAQIRAGLEAAAKNRTVSLSDNFDDVYTTLYNEKGYVITERADVIDLGGDRVVIECTDDWDRIQLMPYFSNTFDTVYYKNTLNSEPNISEQYGATLVVQIIHESELAMLLKRW